MWASMWLAEGREPGKATGCDISFFIFSFFLNQELMGMTSQKEVLKRIFFCWLLKARLILLSLVYQMLGHSNSADVPQGRD